MPIFWEKHLRIKKCVIKAVKTRLLGERKQSGAGNGYQFRYGDDLNLGRSP